MRIIKNLALIVAIALGGLMAGCESMNPSDVDAFRIQNMSGMIEQEKPPGF